MKKQMMTALAVSAMMTLAMTFSSFAAGNSCQGTFRPGYGCGSAKNTAVSITQLPGGCAVSFNGNTIDAAAFNGKNCSFGSCKNSCSSFQNCKNGTCSTDGCGTGSCFSDRNGSNVLSGLYGCMILTR